MFAPSALDIQKALERLAGGLGRYQWLQAMVSECNVTTDGEFQRRFTVFYRVRRSSEWRAAFFALMEKSKSSGINFLDALRAIRLSTGRIEASFASKLVATLDPSKPVVDKFVLQCFQLRLPNWGLADREVKTVELYRQLCLRYDGFMTSANGVKIRNMFDEKYPNATITDIKKIDLVLWQIRPD
ncbi:MAG: hypothetical protein ACRD3B_01900 [Candidatus Sulfotelmatobacter sp.]